MLQIIILGKFLSLVYVVMMKSCDLPPWAVSPIYLTPDNHIEPSITLQCFVDMNEFFRSTVLFHTITLKKLNQPWLIITVNLIPLCMWICLSSFW